jgi:hypothetical protein
MKQYLPGAVFAMLGNIWLLDYFITNAPIYIFIAITYWLLGIAMMFLDNKGPPTV